MHAYGCWRIDVHGRAVESTTPMAERADPALTAAMTVLAANKQARLAGALATVGRMETSPGASDSVAARVSLWLDVRADGDEAVDRLVTAVARQARDRAERDGTRVDVGLVERGPL
jgi:N-carbamoyl-L-amino-acid hydrolase